MQIPSCLQISTNVARLQFIAHKPGQFLSGFVIVGTPRDARLARLDVQKVNDLQNIQWQIVNYWQQKSTLPEALSDLEDPISGFIVPADPQTRVSYGYKVTGALSFELCADFNTDGGDGYGALAYPRAVYEKPSIGIEGGTWSHGAGETCFERVIDPELYPVR